MVSVTGLLFLLAYAEGQQTERWLMLVGLSMVYLAVLTLVAKMVFPVQTIQAVIRGSSAVFKLALVCNYFSVLLLLLIALNTWWSRSLILAVLFGVSLLGMWIFKIVLEPSFGSRAIPRFHNPTAPQGRKARYD